MAITAVQVKQLRDTTGAGMMDAKRALTQTGGDMEAAVDWLRTKGLVKAAKKAGRTTAEGLVAVAVDGGRGVAVEVNSETDFVGKNAKFQAMVSDIAGAALGVSDIEALKVADLGGKSVEATITDNIATIGENISLRRMAAVESDTVVSYIHNPVSGGLGKIAVLVALKGADNGIGRQIAMHVAAAGPQALSADDLAPALVERERNILTGQARESGKPEQVIGQMIEGRMKKFLSEVTLLGQAFVINPDQTVAEAAAEAGVEVVGFVRLELGEGIEKKEEDFAAEVVKAARG